MSAPTVHPTTTATYDLLPLAYREADARQDYPLLRWLSLLVDQLGEVSDAVDAIDVRTPDEGGAVGDTSALTDPVTADPAWLQWLGQFVGLRLPSSYTPAQMRAAIEAANFARGTKKTIEAIARRYLVPGATLVITERVGDRWHYTVHAYTSQVTSPDALLAALQLENPAGMVLTLSITGGSYSDLADGMSGGSYADFPTTFADYGEIASFEP